MDRTKKPSDMVDIYGNEVSVFSLVERSVRFGFDESCFVLANVYKNSRAELTIDKMIAAHREIWAKHEAFVAMLCDIYTPIPVVPAPKFESSTALREFRDEFSRERLRSYAKMIPFGGLLP